MPHNLKAYIPWTVWMILVMFVTVGILIIFFTPPILQPLTFNHSVHAEFGCLTCHEGIETQARASLPDFILCTYCHDEPAVTAPTEIVTWNRAVDTMHVSWNRLRTLDAHVYFSHRRHVTLANLECATCHGDMASQTTPPPSALKSFSMQKCMDCHTKENTTNDCASCHK